MDYGNGNFGMSGPMNGAYSADMNKYIGNAGTQVSGSASTPYPNVPGGSSQYVNMFNTPASMPSSMDPDQSSAQQPSANPTVNVMDEDMQQFMERGYLMGPDCFGRDARRYAEKLMEFINDEYRDSIYYSVLSKRAPTNNARRIFRTLSVDEMKHSRRFAAAYFLITGKRYFPTRSSVEPVIVPTSYVQALRERYIAETRDAIKYRQFARSVNDRCLKRMATDTSDDEQQHAQEILSLIQAM